MNRARLLARGARALGVTAGGIGVAAATLVIAGPDLAPTPAGAQAPSGATVEVERRTLVATEELDGSLGFDGDDAVLNQGEGTVTGLPAAGDVIGRGQRLFELDGLPVVLLVGDRPAWRRLDTASDEGPDVRQLEENLVAMGFATAAQVKVDGEYTAATAAAVKRWEKALGLPQDGIFDVGQALFLPGAVRVAAQEATLGARVQPGQKVLAVSSDERVVTVDLEATDSDLLSVGDAVTVTLPDGRDVPATVADVARVATASQGENGQPGTPTIEVTITLDDPSAAGDLDQAPVDVAIERRRAENVLAVPVHALLALAEGGYGVERVDGTYVAVETGLFADGLVEISGAGIEEGTRLVVPEA